MYGKLENIVLYFFGGVSLITIQTIAGMTLSLILIGYTVTKWIFLIQDRRIKKKKE